jgi:polyhydroxybutyrate depolymerase
MAHLRQPVRALTATLVLLTGACAPRSLPAPDATPTDAAPTADVAPPEDAARADAGLLAARPYRSRVPRDYDPARPTPLIVLLHGYGASGTVQDLYFGLGRLADARGFLYAYPDGTVDATGKRFWNASTACCDFGQTGVDDVAYLTAVLDDMSARYHVDPQRIFVVGHSNGGFMAHRLACDLSPRIAAIVSLAGAGETEPARCRPSSPVSVLQVHGDADDVVRYEGGIFDRASYPGAVETVARWAARQDCGPLEDSGLTLDLDSTLPGAETRVSRHSECPAGAAELWTILGGSHLPSFQPTWPGLVVDWLYAHPKP